MHINRTDILTWDAYKFMINADFILTASRQSIDISRPWNITIRDALPKALVQAIHQLKMHSSMRYRWPWFTTTVAHSSFFAPAMAEFKTLFRSLRVLESQDGNLRLPTELIYVDPAKFGTIDGQAMTLSPSTEHRYLSSKYTPEAASAIVDLGVEELSDAHFVRDLHLTTSQKPNAFRSRPLEWHENLAGKLLPLVNTPELKKGIEKLGIIPLMNGDWVSVASKRQAGFAPKGIDLHDIRGIFPDAVIHPDVEAQYARMALFKSLGAHTLSHVRMGRGFMTMHAGTGPESFQNPATISTAALISQIIYLYRSSWLPARTEKSVFWFAASDDRRYRGPDIFILGVSQVDCPATRISSALGTKYPILHRGYFQDQDLFSTSLVDIESDPDHSWYRAQPPRAGDLIAFLTSTLGLLRSTAPPLVQHDPDDACQFSLSDCFEYLLESCSTSDVLQVISDNWGEYSRYFVSKGPHSCDTCLSCRQGLVKTIRATRVRQTLQNNWDAKIGDLVLPGIDPRIQTSLTTLATLNTPNSKTTGDTLRSHLSHLGVATKQDDSFYMKCLRELQRQGSTVEKDIEYVYEQIQKYYEDDRVGIE